MYFTTQASSTQTRGKYTDRYIARWVDGRMNHGWMDASSPLWRLGDSGLRLAVSCNPVWTAAVLTARLTGGAVSMAGWLGSMG